MTMGLVNQMDLLTTRYGVEYLSLSERILNTLKKMDYDAFDTCQRYIYDYLIQMQKFLDTKKYGNGNYEKIKKNIYDNVDVMLKTYMPGLFLAYSTSSVLYTKFHLFKERLLPLLNNKLSGIEIGFGEGFYIWELSKCVQGISITGFDISEHALTFTSKLLEISNISSENCRLLKENVIDGLNVKNESFDFGILSEVIEHINKPEIAILEIARTLKSNGLLFLSTDINSNHMDHITNFESQEVVEELLTNCGFEVLYKSVYRIQDDLVNTKDITIGLSYICKKLVKK